MTRLPDLDRQVSCYIFVLIVIIVDCIRGERRVQVREGLWFVSSLGKGS